MIKRILISILAFVFLSELAIRVIKAQRPTHELYYTLDEMTHYPRPYVMAAAKPFTKFSTDVHNALGYRGDLPELPKSDSEYRIFIVGGSVVQAEETTLTGWMNKKNLEYLNKKIKFYNFGVGSSVSRQDLIRILIDLIPYNPDLIIHYGGGNDLLPSYDRRINYPHLFLFYELNFAFNKNASIKQTLLYLASKSELLRILLKSPLEDYYLLQIPYYFKDDQNVAKYRALSYLVNLTQMEHMVESQGIKFLSILHPYLNVRKQMVGNEPNYTTTEFRAASQDLREFLYKSLSSPKLKDLNFYDCSHIFDASKDEVYKDYIHLNKTGQPFAADCVAEKLSQYFSSKPNKTVKPIAVPEHNWVTGAQSFDEFLNLVLKN